MNTGKRIDIKIGFACNNRCKFCVQGDKRNICKPKPSKAVELILKRNAGKYKGVVFTGGEPTLRNDIIRLVRVAKKLGYGRIQIQTNGRLFSYPEFCEDMIDAGANEFSPAIHGPNSSVHDFLTSAEGSFIQTIRGIRNLRRSKQYVLTNTVITTSNFRLLPEIARLLVDLDVNQFQFAFPHITGSAWLNRNWLIPSLHQITPFVKKALRIGIMAGKRAVTEAIPYCIMPGYEQCVAESSIPETKVFDAGLVVKDYAQYRVTNGKTKGRMCTCCKYYKVCEGPWKEYPELFGWREFTPKE